MARKVILDTDPGIDDAVALTLALFDPELEVLGVTAVAGNVPAEQATSNVHTILEQLDPPRWPRLGAAGDPDTQLLADARHIFGVNGLGDADFPVAELHHTHPSEKIITDILREFPEEVTIIALGPLTNLARAFHREPALHMAAGQIVMMGGAVTAPGNVTPAAEFNIYCDPPSAQAVFRTPVTKTLVPLDVTAQVTFTFDFLQELPDETTRAGRFLHRILPFAYRTHRRELGLEAVLLHDAVTLAVVTHPELFETEPMPGDVETAGQLTTGATVFDRRQVPQWRNNMEVATGIDTAAVRDYIIRGLRRAGELT